MPTKTARQSCSASTRGAGRAGKLAKSRVRDGDRGSKRCRLGGQNARPPSFPGTRHSRDGRPTGVDHSVRPPRPTQFVQSGAGCRPARRRTWQPRERTPAPRSPPTEDAAWDELQVAYFTGFALELPQPAVPARATTIHRPRCHALPKRRRHVAACQLLLPGCDRNPQPDAGAPYRQPRPSGAPRLQVRNLRRGADGTPRVQARSDRRHHLPATARDRPTRSGRQCRKRTALIGMSFSEIEIVNG